ncbi:hypothetical protein ADK86_35875 [Streptomyces sp. NRRL F-5755]|uniref:hypothetical protein n=1 Tax=Streptomyces sp. NRRL F-5755 TaxID=1519475 RepID=UPI0006AF1DF5|nr:hypothetical protein [Streptomyces sp. NRRL F-5755]KOT87610.1 hypothetical protein ADK86_35875 [Streptomyces sp. NRRL F-5755]
MSAPHSQETPRTRPLELIAGVDLTRALDALFVNAPLRDYALHPRVNDYALPVLGMAYIATYAREAGFNVGVSDAEAHGLGIAQTTDLINAARPFAARTTTAMTRPRTSTASPRLRPGAPAFPPTAGPLCSVGQQEELAAHSVGENPLETVDPAHGPSLPRCLA